jgi:hypothetical protein
LGKNATPMEDREAKLSIKELHGHFVNPDAAYRGKPFWSWNGKLEKEELLRQIQIIKKMGFGGFFMHSRTGLATEYLGEEWFELINTCAAEAEKLGMEAWLYDEDRWPSGTAGGKVTEEPGFRLKFIVLQIFDGDQFSWDEGIIAAFHCRLEGLAFYDCRQFHKDEEPSLLKGRQVLEFRIEEMEKESFYNGFTYVDTLNKEATDKFIELTHEKYKYFCGDKFGTTIKGIFTDEPHRGSLLDGFGIKNKNKEWLIPWTYTLFSEFEKRFGYDPVPHLPELFLQPEGRKVSQVKWHYVELLQQMFLENFAKPLNDWCLENNLILTGHVLHEDSLTAQTAVSGSVMRYYEHMAYPGVDVLTEGNVNYWVVKQLSSAARQLGQKWLLSELYGCTGWQMPLEGHKAVGDWQTLFGINLRCHHLSWYIMEGEAKRDYPASIFHQSAWWEDYDYVEAYFSRLGLIMSQGKPSCDLLVLNPVESLWCQIYPGWSKSLSAQSPDVQKLEGHYRDLFHWLSGMQIDFDYGDEEMISRMCDIRTDQGGEPVLSVGEAEYRTVLVSGMTTIRSTTLSILEQFIEAGGRVVFMGDLPDYVDALPSTACFSLSEKTCRYPLQLSSLNALCGQGIITRNIAVTDAVSGRPMEQIFCQMRDDGDRKYVMLLNVNREQAYPNTQISFKMKGVVEEWDSASGKRYAVPYHEKDGAIHITADFPPAGERLYVIVPEKEPGVGPKIRHRDTPGGKLEGPFEYKLSEPNVCVLDTARYRFGHDDWSEEKDILKIDREIRRRLGLKLRSGDMVQPWYGAEKTHDPRGRLFLRFHFAVEEPPKGAFHLVMEHPETFKITVNGHNIDNGKEEGWWIDKCFRKLSVPSECIVGGENYIELETDFHQGANLEAIYLLGEFGLRLAGSEKILSSLPKQLKLGDLTEQSLPFYTGIVTYMVGSMADIRKDKSDRIILSFPGFEAACVKVRSTTGPDRMVAWQPYEADITSEVEAGESVELDVILTRRNTFGPLHLASVYSWAYGPESFVTEGESFCKEYALIPSGLLQAPLVLRRSIGK